MAVKVCKFGGTSMADASPVESVKKIIASDPERRYIVVSAPGKRYSQDIKVTDLLYRCHAEILKGERVEKAFAPVRDRFSSISLRLGVADKMEGVLEETRKRISKEKDESFTVSRGEYLCARMVAFVLGAEFIDAEDIISFRADGSFDETSYKKTAAALDGVSRAVIPGFYGRGADGKIKTFSRGGSDISGAIVARSVNASVYENWTDVSGFLACDPRIVLNPKRIKKLSYKELRELSYMGADVLHSESIFPVRSANIPILIKNTFAPDDEGTEILPSGRYQVGGNVITGIAGKKDFTVIFIEKSLMNAQVGFMCKVLSVLAGEGVSVEHVPSGIDTMSLVMESCQLDEDKLSRIVEGIKRAVNPDLIRVNRHVAMIATVGHGMSSSVGTSARLFSAIASANINVRMIDMGSSELNLIVGVDDGDYEKCIRAIYGEFFS